MGFMEPTGGGYGPMVEAGLVRRLRVGVRCAHPPIPLHSATTVNLGLSRRGVGIFRTEFATAPQRPGEPRSMCPVGVFRLNLNLPVTPGAYHPAPGHTGWGTSPRLHPPGRSAAACTGSASPSSIAPPVPVRASRMIVTGGRLVFPSGTAVSPPGSVSTRPDLRLPYLRAALRELLEAPLADRPDAPPSQLHPDRSIWKCGFRKSPARISGTHNPLS